MPWEQGRQKRETLFAVVNWSLYSYICLMDSAFVVVVFILFLREIASRISRPIYSPVQLYREPLRGTDMKSATTTTTTATHKTKSLPRAVEVSYSTT